MFRQIRTVWLVPCVSVFLLLMFLTVPSVSQAANKYWIGDPLGGDWSFVFNWSPVDGLYEVPVAGDNVYIINTGSVMLNMAQPSYPVPITGSLQSLVLENSTLFHGGDYVLNVSAPSDPAEPWNTWGPPAIGFGVNGTYSLTANGTLNSARTVVGVGGLFGPGPEYIPTNNPPLSGASGSGIVYQGGTTTANHGELWLGFNTYGEYNLFGGTVNIGGYENGTLVIGGKDWYGTSYVGTGVFNQTGGDVYVNGLGLFMADGSGSRGTYNLGPSGTLTVNGFFVIGGTGGIATFNQTGGVNTANNTLEVGGSGTGTYNLTYGDLNTGSTIVGNWGIGTFNQGYNPETLEYGDGGNHIVQGDLIVGNYSEGTYNLVNGNLSVGGLACIGYNAQGYFNQSGGNFTLSGGSLYLGMNPGSTGEYNMTGGTLSTGTTVVGNGGDGYFIQEGGSHTVSGDLYMGYEAGSYGDYYLNGDSSVLLQVGGNELIGWGGSGSFTQDGGTHNVSGDLNLGQSDGTVGYFDLNGGDLAVGGSLNIGHDGLGTFTQTGGTNTVGFNLVLGNNSTGNGFYYLNGGSLSATYVYVGLNGIGMFTQTGGSHAVSGYLTLGQEANSTTKYSGTYNLSGTGSLTVGTNDVNGDLTIGYRGNGLFTQSDAASRVTVNGALVLGGESGGYGRYEMNGGVLTTNFLQVARSGNGDFVQTGGTVNVVESLNNYGGVNLGQVAGSTGTYRISGGILNARALLVGASGTGVFTQETGSQVNIREGVVLSGDTSTTGIGSYYLNGGDLNAAYTIVGAWGTGTFTQTDGNHTLTGNLIIAETPTGTGTYNLIGGRLDVSGSDGGYGTGYTIVGHNGTGEFNQYSGSIFKAGVLVLGGGPYAGMDPAKSTGVYNMYGGTLTASSIEVGRDDGKGIFNQTGGSVTTGHLSLGMYPGGNGEYTIGNNATLKITGNMMVGEDSNGKGVFTQKDTSVVEVTDTIWIGKSSIYNFQGGFLSAANIFVTQGGVFRGTGSVFANMEVTGSTVAPGNSPGTLTINGNYSQDAASTLLIELAGTQQGVEYDLLKVNGSATLTGTLQIVLDGGYTPVAGTHFDILVADVIYNVFTTITGPTGWAWNVAYLDLIGNDGKLDTVQLTANAVPIPGAVWFFAPALAGLIGLRRRRLG